MPGKFELDDPTSFEDDRSSIDRSAFDETPYIRISRNGSVTDIAAGAPRTRISGVQDVDDEEIAVRPARGTRPMPKRLSEEAREAAERARRAQIEEAEAEASPEKKPRKRTSKKKAAAVVPPPEDAEQMALPLKPQREKPDSMVKQRHVLGFSCIVAAILVLLAIISYSPDDASRAETRISDLPALFLPSSPGDVPDPVREAVRASADQAKNWLGLIGAMLANFLINKTIGYAAIIYPIFFGWWSLAFFRFTYKQRRRLTLATTFFLLTAILFSATMGTAANFINLPREWFGSVGQFLGLAFARAIGGAGAFILYAAAFIVMLIFSIDLDIEKTFLRLRTWWTALVMWSRRKIIEFWEKREARQAAREEERAREEAEEAALEAAKVEAIQAGGEIAIASEVAEPIVAKEALPTEEPVEDVKISIRSAKSEAPVATKPQALPVREKAVVKAAEASVPVAEAIAPTVAAAEPQAVNPLPKHPTPQPGQPLLKVRPAQKHEGATPIPRLTRNSKDRLGSHSVHFSRLTNGALSDEPEKPAEELSAAALNGAASVAKPVVASSVVDGLLAITKDKIPAKAEAPAEPTVEISASEISNVDTTEDVIDPLKPKVKESKRATPTAMTLPPVTVGDEKALSNEALPHSVSEEVSIVRPLVRMTDTKPAQEADEESSDLFFEEGKKPFVPENPYQEILLKYRSPSLDILTPADPKDALDANDEELAKKGRLLRDKLATFGVEIENITVTPGPVVTLYEFTPAEGIKVSRVENLTDDIALAMKARGIRIIAPIPGRGTIGVEIPNDTAKMVRIRSLFESDSFRHTKMNLPLALGKTISGDVYVDDLNKMPHLLIAGATGSGKSVGVNGIIASLLYAKSPRDVKFVIVDPKKIELSLYKKLRKHYLIVSPEAGEDIVTTPQMAVVTLKAVEVEMERRYDKLAKAAVRSLADYNIKVAQGKLRSTQEEQHYHLPYIVVIIDELADLMITAAREIEEPICRIAQMARAVGIHLILATQRPSVDVITGVIKANFPARIAYQVATRVDSRTILDTMGAEQLLGNGDMLYQPSGTPKPIRLQSPYISTDEVEAMIDAIAMQDGDKLSYSRPWYLPSLRDKESRGGSGFDEEDARDDLFEEAARTIVRHQQGSVSLLQRRLKIGYSRAARIMDELEAAAIVGAFDGSKARQVLCENDAELEVVLEGLR